MMKQTITTVANEVSDVLHQVDEEQAVGLSQHLQTAERIFIAGEGRSGLMGKAFAMRLMHGGFTVFVTGETITPSIGQGDLLVAISGSGSTASIVQFANKAKEAGAKVCLVTTNPDAELAGRSDSVLLVPAATKKRRPEEPDTIQPLGNQFDQSIHLLLDAIIIQTMQTNENSSYQDMTNRHANLE
ncbi:6-phospho-3-hexuloisomerase [Thalassobacillus sp. CUG 92003]|uniref:6-phospho-3-hexuloisomerase n=1 Tax=Thalassobacillus sp. CUG 92003 TaxID=2736641 RepID=UPI00210256FE|nr:6-phospho-3-hexuloisomerase [Thalassobacillus sp. CUG 92003]